MKDIVLRKIDYLNLSNFIYPKVPERMLYLSDMPSNMAESTPYQSLEELLKTTKLVFSDLYRTPQASLLAYKNKTGVAKPGYSGHNYGISFDIDVDKSMRINNLPSYSQLVKLLVQVGWTPYQGVSINNKYDRGREDWHFNYVGADNTYWKDTKASNPLLKGSGQVDSWIRKNYEFPADTITIQTLLQKLKLYQGDIDGISGPMMRKAILSFKKSWYPPKLSAMWQKPDLDPTTIRMIHIVSCDVKDINGNKLF